MKTFLPQDIEARSFAIITKELEQEGICLPAEQAPVIKRCIHTSADFDYARNLSFSEGVIEKALHAIRNGASIVTDIRWAAPASTKNDWNNMDGKVYCFMSDEDVASAAKEKGTTRLWQAWKRPAP